MTIFCYVCKRHVHVQGESAKARLAQFHAFGHSDAKVARLKKGMVGA